MTLSILTVNNIDATMTSLELVERINVARRVEATEAETESQSIEPNLLRHDNFMAKLEKHPGIDSPKFLGQYKDGTGRTLKCYFLPRRECELMIMSESLLVQTRVYDQLAGLTAKQAAPVMALPQDYIQALESLLASKKSEQLAIEQRDHAIKTKAQIGDRRQATSMAKVAVANREVAKLKEQLGFSARHATILQVEDALGGDFNFLPLRNWCKANEVIPQTVPDKRYPKGVKAWPAGAWANCYGVDLMDLFGEVAA